MYINNPHTIHFIVFNFENLCFDHVWSKDYKISTRVVFFKNYFYLIFHWCFIVWKQHSNNALNYSSVMIFILVFSLEGSGSLRELTLITRDAWAEVWPISSNVSDQPVRSFRGISLGSLTGWRQRKWPSLSQSFNFGYLPLDSQPGHDIRRL